MLLLYTALVHAHHFMLPAVPMEGTQSYISRWLIQDVLFADQLPYQIRGLIQLLMITGTGFALGILMQRYKLLNKPSLLPAMTFVLLCSFFPGLFQAMPEIWCGLIVMTLLFKIFGAYNKQRSDMTYFDAGALSITAVLLYPPMVILLVFSIIALFRMRSTSFREFVIYLIGMLTIVFLTGTVLYWFGQLEDFWQDPQWTFHFFAQAQDSFTTMRIVKLSLIGAVLIMALLLYLDKIATNLIQIRRYMVVCIWLLLAGIPVAALAPAGTDGAWYILLIPAAIIISYYFFHSKLSLYTESAHAVLFVATILMQYVTFV